MKEAERHIQYTPVPTNSGYNLFARNKHPKCTGHIHRKNQTTPENHEQRCTRLFSNNRLCDGSDWTALFRRTTGSTATGRRIKLVLCAFSNVGERCKNASRSFIFSLNTYEHRKIHCHKALAEVQDPCHRRSFTPWVRIHVGCFIPLNSTFECHRQRYLLGGQHYDGLLVHGDHHFLSNCNSPGPGCSKLG